MHILGAQASHLHSRRWSRARRRQQGCAPKRVQLVDLICLHSTANDFVTTVARRFSPLAWRLVGVERLTQALVWVGPVDRPRGIRWWFDFPALSRLRHWVRSGAAIPAHTGNPFLVTRTENKPVRAMRSLSGCFSASLSASFANKGRDLQDQYNSNSSTGKRVSPAQSLLHVFEANSVHRALVNALSSAWNLLPSTTHAHKWDYESDFIVTPSVLAPSRLKSSVLWVTTVSRFNRAVAAMMASGVFVRYCCLSRMVCSWRHSCRSN